MIRSGYQKGIVLRSTVRDWLKVAAPEARWPPDTMTSTDSPNQSPVHEENDAMLDVDGMDSPINLVGVILGWFRWFPCNDKPLLEASIPLHMIF